MTLSPMLVVCAAVCFSCTTRSLALLAAWRSIEYWTDVLGLDYSQPALWDAMNDALLYWVREADIDGYRCDVAGLLPTAYWEQVRIELDKIKPVFMLAEWSTVDRSDGKAKRQRIPEEEY